MVNDTCVATCRFLLASIYLAEAPDYVPFSYFSYRDNDNL